MSKYLVIFTAYEEDYERGTANDYLRTLASFGVMIMHLIAPNLHTVRIYSGEWQVLIFVITLYDGLCRFFVMISGALFLSRDI